MSLTLLLTSYTTFLMWYILFGFHFTEVQNEEFENMRKRTNNSIVKHVPKSSIGISEKRKYKWLRNVWKMCNFISNQEHAY